MPKEDVDVLVRLVRRLKSDNQGNQVQQEFEQMPVIDNQMSRIYTVLEETLSRQPTLMQEETPTINVSAAKQQLKRELLKLKFAKKQEEFNANFKIDSKMEEEVLEYETCQQCKLPIEPNQKSCFPALLE
jgi:hypothetical protein